MRLTYDDVADALYLYLREGIPVARSVVVDDDRTVDLDDEGRPIGIEILGASGGVRLRDLGGSFDLSGFESHLSAVEAMRFAAVEFA